MVRTQRYRDLQSGPHSPFILSVQTELVKTDGLVKLSGKVLQQFVASRAAGIEIADTERNQQAAREESVIVIADVIAMEVQAKLQSVGAGQIEGVVVHNLVSGDVKALRPNIVDAAQVVESTIPHQDGRGKGGQTFLQA